MCCNLDAMGASLLRLSRLGAMTMRAVLTIILLFVACCPSIADVSESNQATIRAMHWVDAKNVRLDTSQSTIINLHDFRVILGAEAQRFREIVDASNDSHQEASAIDPNSGN